MTPGSTPPRKRNPITIVLWTVGLGALLLLIVVVAVFMYSLTQLHTA